MSVFLIAFTILPGMEAGSCGLRRFFTSLYSLPSFLFRLGAASLLPSLKQTEPESKTFSHNPNGLHAFSLATSVIIKAKTSYVFMFSY